MEYYESAEGIQITRDRATLELRKHGCGDLSVRDFFQELGDSPTYLATDVLDWLGY